MAWRRTESLTFFQYVLKVRHTLNICSGNVLVLTTDGLDLTAEFPEHIRISHEKAAVERTLVRPR